MWYICFIAAYLRTTLLSRVLASKVLEEITQDFSGNRKYSWPSCLLQISGVVRWEIRVQWKRRKDTTDMFLQICFLSDSQYQ